ncbi:TetR/AcrR family transcriptional regulator [Nocardia sp. NBC_01503]|uniref:TetR/AcrR family transcriptional regulator n=1 Tax=Nocardia sp. NBC_01503 TaxID=2975997 RepID=UPI002E7B1C47|nr:helix-turn-helix domain-containing protein [Nocardia sp. NBC_01503]WTL32865.1 TetR/AcrR family transcriptional regulator [Nocardia sp. NBC_01503]
MGPTAEQLRADARSNRDQIIDAALAVFRERGTDIPMKEIADRAGVGVGTLYRRFPDRDALLIATTRAHLERLAELAATAWREERTAWGGMRRFLRECVEMQLGAQSSAIGPTVHKAMHADPRLTEVRAAVVDLVARMTVQAQADGDLRPDVGPEDIALIMTVQVYTREGESYLEAVDRVMTIMVDGLRPQPDSAS